MVGPNSRMLCRADAESNFQWIRERFRLASASNRCCTRTRPPLLHLGFAVDASVVAGTSRSG